MQEQFLFADKVIARSPTWKLELIKFNLGIEATALQLPTRGVKKGDGFQWHSHKSHFLKGALSPRARCREGTRAAWRPPPPCQQSPHRGSCTHIKRLRRVGRHWTGTAAGKSQPGRQRRKQMVQSAGERRHLPTQAPSQGDGTAPASTRALCWVEETAGRASSPLSIPPSKHGCPHSCTGANITLGSMCALRAAVRRKMSDLCLQLRHWQKLAQQFACKLYPGKYFWKGIRLLA